MLRRSTKIQLIAFVIVTLLGVSYTSANFVGLTFGFLGPTGCTVSADFPDSGGIFTGAEVTYRGVSIGKVGQLNLIDNGVRADLDLTDCKHPAVPKSSMAEVSDRSVIGEQYVDIIPPDGNGPYMKAGDDIPMSRNRIPLPPQALLANLDSLVRSVDATDLQIVIGELGQAFNGRGQDLGNLIDATDTLLAAADDPVNLRATIDVINQSRTVLASQLEETSAIQSWAHSLNLLSGQLKTSDPDIRNLLQNGPGDLRQISSFVTANAGDLGVTLANLATTGTTLVRHIGGIEEILELYPTLSAAGLSVLDGNGIGRLALPTNSGDPPDCGLGPTLYQPGQGYGGTQTRVPQDTTPRAPNVGATCNLPASSGTDVRGAANVPGADPVSTSGAGVVYPRAVTANTVMVGDTGVNAGALGDKSWLTIIMNGLH